MSIDMTQFLVTFYEESFEGLEIMESELLNLDVGAADAETINTIFRAAHSIKGGSGTFGLNAVASFTHVMETLLDEMRDGKRDVTQEGVEILLSSVDVLREMLQSLRDDLPLNHDAISVAQEQLDNLLNGSANNEREQVNTVTDSYEQGTGSNISETGCWKIYFNPNRDMYKTGNDAVRIIRELEELGEIEVRVDTSSLPGLDDIESEDSYLSWEIILKSDTSETDIREVFAWVEDECDLIISPYSGDVGDTKKSSENKPELNVAVLEKSFDALAPQAEALAARFYESLFSNHPEVKPLFKNTTPEKQQAKLLAALKLVVGSLKNPEALVKSLTEMGARHQAYGAVAEHYDVVASTLISTMKELAGDLWTSEVNTAWQDALGIIAGIMLDAYQPVVASGQQSQSTTPKASTPTKQPANTNKPATESRKASGSGETSIRVSIDKVDELINTVGELVITQAMLGQFGELEELDNSHLDTLRDGLSQLERNTRELQESVMRIRMLPISFAFQRFPRLVHDLSSQLGKKVELKMSGEQTELDKTVMEKIGDPLVHLVRNSMDHGIESPEKRIAAGKSEMGLVHLDAYHQGGNIVIEITDDGGGLNTEKILAKARSSGLVSADDNLTEDQVHDLIFQPGFSTADQVSDVSGRGVGMDVVRRNIRSLGGTVDVKSKEGDGSTFRIRLPLTLAILDGQLIRVGTEIYIIPLVSIIESVQVHKDKVNVISGRGEVYKLRDDYIPIVRLYHAFGLTADSTVLDKGLLVVVEAEGHKVALFVDELLAQQQVVIKSLETNYKKVEGLSGATILGDGTVALILDVVGLYELSKKVTTHPGLNLSSSGSSEDGDIEEIEVEEGKLDIQATNESSSNEDSGGEAVA
ncbi:MAG: chemotaxis protein CheW [Gammaproteobacteria bacterium]|nr:chemotaxis protein CheW [Gammaproteobacteria bacterium]